MALKHNVGGTWRDVIAWVNVGGVWKKATVWHNVAGIWKQITSLISATLPAGMTASSSAVAPDLADARVVFQNNGAWALSGNDTTLPAPTGDWWDGISPASAYEIRWTPVIGWPTTGPAVNAWHSLSLSRTWTALDTNTAEGTVEIREAASGGVLASSLVVLSAFTDGGGIPP